MVEALRSAGGGGGAVGGVEMQAGGAGAQVALQAGGAGGGLARVAQRRGSGGGAGGGHGWPGLALGGPRGKGRVESGSKSLKKHLLRDFSSFSPYQVFSPKKSPLFGFLVPKVSGTYEKVPVTK